MAKFREKNTIFNEHPVPQHHEMIVVVCWPFYNEDHSMVIECVKALNIVLSNFLYKVLFIKFQKSASVNCEL